MIDLDKRLHAYRHDLADIKLKKYFKDNSPKFAKSTVAQIAAPIAAIYKDPDIRTERMSECLMGEDIFIFEEKDNFCWIQAAKDGYVGYVERKNIISLPPISKKPSHWLSVPRSFIYKKPDLKSQIINAISMGSRFTIIEYVETRGTIYAKLQNGNYVIKNHLRPITDFFDDYVHVAEQFINTPYLWGGVSGFGLDCSGLVQLSMQMANKLKGKMLLRDTDMQRAQIEKEVTPEFGIQRGDLVFWQGHVAIMLDADTIIHANGASMQVNIEPLPQAIGRIAKFYGKPLCYKRP